MKWDNAQESEARQKYINHQAGINKGSRNRWHYQASQEQRKTVADIEMESKILEIPPSEVEARWIAEGKLKYDWDV